MSETVELRRAVLADAPLIHKLTRDAYAPLVSRIGREPLPMTADHTKAVRDHCVEVLWLGGTLAAVIEMIPRSDHLLVENVAVLPRL